MHCVVSVGSPGTLLAANASRLLNILEMNQLSEMMRLKTADAEVKLAFCEELLLKVKECFCFETSILAGRTLRAG